MNTLALSFLGEPRIERNGKAIQFDTRKAAALLAYLAVTHSSHSRDALATLLYPESDQVKSRGALRRTLSALKAALGEEWLDADRENIGFVPRKGLSVDVDEFHAYLAECTRHGHAANDVCSRCIEPLGKAVALYRDDFLSGFSLRDSPNYDDWQFFTSETLRRELVTALAKLVCRCSEDGLYEEAINYSRRWLTYEPLEEPGHRQLMRLYAWTGQRTAALRQYRECVRLLEQELGVAPLEETTELYRAIEENREPRPATKPFEPAPVTGKREKQAPAAKGKTRRTIKPEAKAEPLDHALVAAPAHLAPAAPYPFVGRESDLARLIALYHEMKTDGRLVVLEGEAGIGKTRLAEEFIARVRDEGGVTITARCYEGQGNLAYGPFVEGLRALDLPARSREWLDRISPQALSEAARLLPELAALEPLPPLLPLEGPGGQSRFLDSVSQLLLALCGKNACGVLLIDDLQWADGGSLDLLTFLVRRLRGRPLFILGTWRAEDLAPDHRLRQLLAEAERSRTGLSLILERLDRTAVERLVRAAAPAAASDRTLSERLYRESEGQPFFVVEYLSLLAGEQAGRKDWPLPNSVRAVLHSRLARVSETARQLLSAAAVIGRSFDFDTLSEASGRSDVETVAGLEELLSLGLVKEVPQGAGERAPTLDFVHEKLRALAYEETSLVRRRLLHKRVAESLANRARRGRETERQANRIAHHYQAAGLDREAADYYKTAGDYARSLYANAEALEHYRAALALGYPDAAVLHEAIGDLQTLSGEYSAALHSYETAAAFRDGQESGALESKTAEVYARRGEWDLADKHFRAALEALGEDKACVDCAHIYGDWSLVALKSGDLTRARQRARHALKLAEGAGDKRSIAQAHNILGILARHDRHPEQAFAHLEKSRTLGEELADPRVRSAALNNLALVAMDRGDPAAGIQYAQEALALSQAQGDRHREAALRNNLADLYHAIGDADAAMTNLREAVTIYAEIGTEAGAWQPEVWKLAEW